ncbi:MAG: tellurium resistance protein TerC [Pseudomonadota bacterium]
MADLFTLENLLNLSVLIFLQAVLGFDNLLYISIESKRAPERHQAAVRKWGIIIAIALRIVLLFTMIQLLASLTEPFFKIDLPGVILGEFNFASIVFLFGGAFLMYTAVKEISHLLAVEHLEHGPEERSSKSAASVVAMIVMMNLIFSFDSILSAIAITDVFVILAIAILLSGLGMLLLADRVSEFLERNRKYEVLGLFILLIVAVVLLGEGGHVAHLTLFDYKVEAMSKTTFYFSIVVLVAVDILQSGYQKKLEKTRKQQGGGH